MGMKGAFLVGAGKGPFPVALASRRMAKRDEQDLEVTDSTRPKKQQTRLKGWLALCCELYKAALPDRRETRLSALPLARPLRSARLQAARQQLFLLPRWQVGALQARQVKLDMHRPLKGMRYFGHRQTHSNGQVVRLDLL